jgi:hypothetical protein
MTKNMSDDIKKYSKLLDNHLKKLDKYDKIYNTITNQEPSTAYSNINFDDIEFDMTDDESITNIKNIISELSKLNNNLDKNVKYKNAKPIINTHCKHIIKKSSSKIGNNCKELKKIIIKYGELLKKEFPDDLNEKFSNLQSNSQTQTIEHFPGVKKIINAFKSIGKGFKTVINKISNFGKALGKALSSVFKKIFGVMLMIFNFIAKKLIPALMKAIKFLIKYVPKFFIGIFKFFKTMFKIYVRIIKNYIKSPILPLLIFVGLFFGMQKYLIYITGIDASIPPIGILIICGLMVLSLIYSKVDILVKYHKILIKYIIKFFKSKIIKKIFKMPKNMGSSPPKIILIILKTIFKNLPLIFISILAGLYAFKFSSGYIIDKVSALYN